MNKPFIIKNIGESLVPIESDQYDVTQQNRIQIVQAMNGYLTISMLYQSFKLMWSFWHYKQQCPDYAYLSLGFMILNLVWALTSYFGFISITSKHSRNITIFEYTVIGNFILRIIMYIICGVVMSGYVKSYEISPQVLNKMICVAIYPQTLFIIQGIFQAIVSLIILYLTKGIISYVRNWELKDTQKHIPKKMGYINQENY